MTKLPMCSLTDQLQSQAYINYGTMLAFKLLWLCVIMYYLKTSPILVLGNVEFFDFSFSANKASVKNIYFSSWAAVR